MGIFHRLQGAILNRIADTLIDDSASIQSFVSRVEPIIQVSKTLGVHQGDMEDPTKSRIVLCYFFGFIEILADHQNLNKDAIIPATTQIFASVFDFNQKETEDSVACVMDASLTEDGRQYSHAGAMAVADYLEQKTPSAVSPLKAFLDSA
jgi:hypothetical protein